ncbi:Ribosome maturation factor RimM [Frankliniella fusca]|uniref:Ribosome maturation factor RimM n=1 Tax=Frankliniella fusca TaxID=407009 RepID=A0AAE1HJ83_9NEOP|nr:Ribosome maturation factor RimM [Frankliniella fusca]
MVKHLKVPTPKKMSLWKRHVLPAKKSLESLQECSISYFMNESTLQFFQIMQIDSAFLSEDPAVWPEIGGYRDGLAKVQSLHVVNDVAERGVALVKRFTKDPMTKDENSFQDLLLVQNELLKEEKHSNQSLTLAHFELKVN